MSNPPEVSVGDLIKVTTNVNRHDTEPHEVVSTMTVLLKGVLCWICTGETHQKDTAQWVRKACEKQGIALDVTIQVIYTKNILQHIELVEVSA